MIVRPETTADERPIRLLLTSAFGGSAEAVLVDRLRAEGDLILSLVAEEGAGLVGHVALSRMGAPFAAVGLGPLAVTPSRRRRGLGRRLVEEALERARPEGWTAMFVLGDPDYYRRFGFSVEAARGFASPYAGPHLMVLALQEGLPASFGRIDYAPAFAEL